MKRPADSAAGGPDHNESKEKRRSVTCLSRSAPSRRGNRRVEVREATAVIAGLFFPTSAGVMLDIEQLPDLIEGLQAAEAAARRRGWLR